MLSVCVCMRVCIVIFIVSCHVMSCQKKKQANSAKSSQGITTYTSSIVNLPNVICMLRSHLVHQPLPPPNRLRTHPVNPPEPSPRLLRRCCCSGPSEPDHGDDHEENDCELQPDGDAASRAADGWVRSRSGLSGITTGLPLVPSAAGLFPRGLLAPSVLQAVREGLRDEAT